MSHIRIAIVLGWTIFCLVCRAYDPAEYENLQVSQEIKEVFGYITAYTPQIVDLDVKLKPFIPDYIPAVGDIDAFIKVPRPDRAKDGLGLTVLDEPSAKNQSDPALLTLKLRATTKDVSLSDVDRDRDAIVGKVATNQRDIESWIENIRSLHEQTSRASASSVTLLQSQRLPDIETLMQEWPEHFEQALEKYGLPTPDMDCSLDEYVQIICGLLDIPVHSSKIASLFLLFSLYNEFQSSQHFKRY